MEVYKCKKCGAEFPKTQEGLSEYKVHCLHCKAGEDSEAGEQPDIVGIAETENETRADAKGAENEAVPGDASNGETKTEDDAEKESAEAEEAKEKQNEAVSNTETTAEAQSEGDDLRKRRKEAMAKNSCRGYAEGNKDGICRNYMKCSDCWADFK